MGGELVNDLRKFFERLTNFHLKLAPKKAHPGVKVVKVIGHRITAEIIAPDPGTLETLLKRPMPTNVSQLRSPMRAVSYYNRNIL